MEPVPPSLPLPTLLSQVLVAHTIELDNEAEHRLPHRTTRDDDRATRRGAAVAGLVRPVGQRAAVRRCRPGHRGRRSASGRARPGSSSVAFVVGATSPSRRRPARRCGTRPRTAPWSAPRAGGRKAHDVWRSLPAVIDDRWRTRFGARAVEHLERALGALFDELSIDPPAYLPVVYPTQNGKAEPAPPGRPGPAHARPPPGRPVARSSRASCWRSPSTSRRTSRISLAISANTLRVLDTDRRHASRDLPRLTGVSKEANAMCAGWLVRHGCAVAGPDPAGEPGQGPPPHRRRGSTRSSKYRRFLGATEESWRSTFGAGAVADLRAALEPLVGDGTLASSPLARGLEPYPDNWRAAVRHRPDTLPHYPMVLHRGGYPDGS